MIIIFEGPAFSGKTHIIDLLVAEWLWKKVPEVLVWENFLSFSVCMRNDLKKYFLAKKLKKTSSRVFVDRSYISTWVYVHLAKTFGFFDKVLDYYSEIDMQKSRGLLKPDICFLFKIKKHVWLSRWYNEIRYKESLIWYKNIALTYKFYNNLLERENIKTIYIDANWDTDSILKQIKKYL